MVAKRAEAAARREAKAKATGQATSAAGDDTPAANADAEAQEATGETALFAKKETKEEKKARMAAKKAAMKAKKAAAGADPAAAAADNDLKLLAGGPVTIGAPVSTPDDATAGDATTADATAAIGPKKQLRLTRKERKRLEREAKLASEEAGEKAARDDVLSQFSLGFAGAWRGGGGCVPLDWSAMSGTTKRGW